MPTRRHMMLRGLAAAAALPLLWTAARASGPAAPVQPPAEGATPVMGKQHAVEISGFAFVPAGLAIAPGDTVVFTNRDLAPHTVTSESGLFESGRLGSGQSVRMSFGQAGDYPYLCSLHPRMRGRIRVG